MSTTHDAIIIGSGHNGLTAAAYLAKSGLSVRVLERRNIIGGATVTEELIPGYRFSAASYIISLFREEIIDDLKLKEHGLELIMHNPTTLAIFPDNTYIRGWATLDDAVREIERFSKNDARAYVRFGTDLAEFGSRIEPMLHGPPPSAEALAHAFADVRGQELYRRFVSHSVQDMLDLYFEHPKVKGPMIHMSMVSVLSHPDTPETSFGYGLHATGRLEGQYGRWGYVKGGMGALSGAIASVAKHYGAEIVSDAEVSEIIVSSGRVKGVKLKNGDRHEANVVLSNADPVTTLSKLLPEDALPSQYREAVKLYDTRGSMARVFYALKGLPTFKALGKNNYGPEYQALIILNATREAYHRAYAESHLGKVLTNPAIHMTIPSTVDPTLAAPGTHTLNTGIQQLPINLVGTNWDKEKESLADTVTDIFEKYAPGFKKLVVDRFTLSPLDYQRVFGLTGGNIFHGSHTISQIFANRPIPGMSNYRLPVQGLYLCGAGAHPGGGVSGLPGRNAAMEVLRDRESLMNDRTWVVRATEANGSSRPFVRKRSGLNALAGNETLQSFSMPLLRSSKFRWLTKLMGRRLGR